MNWILLGEVRSPRSPEGAGRGTSETGAQVDLGAFVRDVDGTVPVAVFDVGPEVGATVGDSDRLRAPDVEVRADRVRRRFTFVLVERHRREVARAGMQHEPGPGAALGH